MRMYDLKQKEVINDCDCRRLGFVSDLLMDFEEGRITHIIVPGPGKFCGVLGRDMEYVIPFGCIRRFGEDILLVQVNAEEVLVKCRPVP
ncbi:MAG: YlmC/YmxH family sporulation protein [Lachnospiraceae bacterium]|nr:YlmC/YmxH family sporulation protein [Lachnospiraceae bacterium]